MKRKPDHFYSQEGAVSVPSSSTDASSSNSSRELSRLSKLKKKYAMGQIPKVDWLDRLAFAEMEKIQKREKSAMKMMFLDVQFTQFQVIGFLPLSPSIITYILILEVNFNVIIATISLVVFKTFQNSP